MPILGIVDTAIAKEERLVEFSKAALKEVLASAHDWTHSSYDSMQFGSRALRATESVLSMRSKAIEIVKKMLLHSQIEVRLAGIDIVEDIGHCPGPGASVDIPLKQRVADERKDMAKFISDNNLITKETDLHVLSSYEDLAFIWWARQDVSDEVSLGLLEQVQYSSEYRIIRYYTSRYDVTDDVRHKLKEAPSKDRWHWVVDNIMQRKWNLTAEDFEKDAIALSEKYSVPSEITNYLKLLGNTVTVSSANAIFLRAWFKQNPEAFKTLRFQKDLWLQIPLIFKYTITYDLVQKYPDIAKTIIDQVLLSPNAPTDEAKIAIDILSYDIPTLDRYGVIKSVAEKNIDDLNLTIIERMRFIREKISAKDMASIILVVLSHLTPPAQAKTADHIALILHGKTKEYVSDFLAITRDVLYSVLLNNGKLDYYDFEIAVLLFADVKDLFCFIDARLKREKEISKYSTYEAIPFNGIEFINKFICSNENYSYAIHKAIEWDNAYEGITSFSVSKIFEQLMSLKDASGVLFFDRIKTEFFTETAFSVCLQCLFKLPLIKSNLALFKEVTLVAMKFKGEDEMVKLLNGKTYPEGGWSSSAGQTPPAFIEKRECYEELRKSVPAGKLRSALDECVRSVEKMIEEHREEEENRFFSR